MSVTVTFRWSSSATTPTESTISPGVQKPSTVIPIYYAACLILVYVVITSNMLVLLLSAYDFGGHRVFIILSLMKNLKDISKHVGISDLWLEMFDIDNICIVKSTIIRNWIRFQQINQHSTIPADREEKVLFILRTNYVFPFAYKSPVSISLTLSQFPLLNRREKQGPNLEHANRRVESSHQPDHSTPRVRLSGRGNQHCLDALSLDRHCLSEETPNA